MSHVQVVVYSRTFTELGYGMLAYIPLYEAGLKINEELTDTEKKYEWSLELHLRPSQAVSCHKVFWFRYKVANLIW